MSKTYSAVEHSGEEYERSVYTALERLIDDKLEECGQLVSVDSTAAYSALLDLLAETLIPAVEDLANRNVTAYAHLDGVESDALMAVSERPVRVRARLSQPGQSRLQAKQQLRDAVTSVESIAAHESVVLDEYSGKVDAVGFETKLGVHLQDREMDIGDPVRLVSERSGALKTLYSGGTGNGKSVCLEREAEDYYRRTLAEGRDYKLIDPAGLRDGENWFYDIPNNDPDLRTRREDLGLPPSAAEGDAPLPDIEILTPLTTDLQSQRLPYDVDEGAFTVRPFTIPAADIRKSLLVSILTAKLTPQQESVIRDAYDTVDQRRDDWALRHLADEIRSRDELDASKRKPPVRTLKQLQNRGFIRTRQCEHALDWRRIFTSTDTFTVFTQSFLDSAIAQLIVFGYLANSIVKKRERMYDIPEAVVVMRELWKIAPHQRRQEFDERAAQLQEAIGGMFARLFRDNRHSAVHVLADTQQPSDLLKPVREMFNRYVIFSTDKKTTKDIFDWTSNDKWKAFYASLTPKPGEASVVGMVEPAVEERGIQFVGPVRYAAASHHHKRSGIDANGWHARTKYLTPVDECPECESGDLARSDDGYTVTCGECGEESTDISGGRCEELRTPQEMGVGWVFELPTKLVMNDTSTSTGPDVAMSPVAAFAERCLEYDPASSVVRDNVKRAFNEYVTSHEDTDREEPWDFDDPAVATRFGERLNGAFEEDLGQTSKGGENAYNNLAFSETGRRHLKRWEDQQQADTKP